jgi:hypothetical protein
VARTEGARLAAGQAPVGRRRGSLREAFGMDIYIDKLYSC